MSDLLVVEHEGKFVAVFLPLREVGIGESRNEAINDLRKRLQSKVEYIQEQLVCIFEAFVDELCVCKCAECPYHYLAKVLKVSTDGCPDAEEVADSLPVVVGDMLDAYNERTQLMQIFEAFVDALCVGECAECPYYHLATALGKSTDGCPDAEEVAGFLVAVVRGLKEVNEIIERGA